VGQKKNSVSLSWAFAVRQKNFKNPLDLSFSSLTHSKRSLRWKSFPSLFRIRRTRDTLKKSGNSLTHTLTHTHSGRGVEQKHFKVSFITRIVVELERF
jgi:hypothetical protein